MLLYIEQIIEEITIVMKNSGFIFGFLIVILESIFPFLPLAAFIALNIISYGSIAGFIISWIATVIGCLISFYIFRKGISTFLYKKIKMDGKVNKFMHYMKNIRYTQLVILVAIPFTPAFAVNIASGLSKMSVKKFFLAIIIGKLSIIYFWSYIGTGFIESISDPYILFEISVIMGIVYVISRLIQKKLNVGQE